MNHAHGSKKWIKGKKTDGNEEYRNIYYHMNPDHERKKFNVGKKYAKQ
jgi:hypothetical protein